MNTAIEQKHFDEIHKRYGLNHLELEHRSSREPIDLDQINKPSTESKLYQEYLEKIRSRYGLPDGLQTNASPPKKEVTTLEDKAIEHNKESRKDIKLSLGSI